MSRQQKAIIFINVHRESQEKCLTKKGRGEEEGAPLGIDRSNSAQKPNSRLTSTNLQEQAWDLLFSYPASVFPQQPAKHSDIFKSFFSDAPSSTGTLSHLSGPFPLLWIFSLQMIFNSYKPSHANGAQGHHLSRKRCTPEFTLEDPEEKSNLTQVQERKESC